MNPHNKEVFETIQYIQNYTRKINCPTKHLIRFLHNNSGNNYSNFNFIEIGSKFGLNTYPILNIIGKVRCLEEVHSFAMAWNQNIKNNERVSNPMDATLHHGDIIAELEKLVKPKAKFDGAVSCFYLSYYAEKDIKKILQLIWKITKNKSPFFLSMYGIHGGILKKDDPDAKTHPYIKRNEPLSDKNWVSIFAPTYKHMAEIITDAGFDIERVDVGRTACPDFITNVYKGYFYLRKGKKGKGEDKSKKGNDYSYNEKFRKHKLNPDEEFEDHFKQIKTFLVMQNDALRNNRQINFQKYEEQKRKIEQEDEEKKIELEDIPENKVLEFDELNDNIEFPPLPDEVPRYNEKRLNKNTSIQSSSNSSENNSEGNVSVATNLAGEGKNTTVSKVPISDHDSGGYDEGMEANDDDRSSTTDEERSSTTDEDDEDDQKDEKKDNNNKPVKKKKE